LTETPGTRPSLLVRLKSPRDERAWWSFWKSSPASGRTERSRGAAKLYDVETFREKAVLRTGLATAGLDFRSDSKRLATSNRAGDVTIWDPATAQRRMTLQGAHDQNIPALAYAPSGLFLATAGADGLIKLWDVSEPPMRRDNAAVSTIPGELADCEPQQALPSILNMPDGSSEMHK
jgi:WD40 repeat protein